ncbi:MAG: type VI secretion system tube protein Hcp [Sedimentisphaerales bacterium]|nr:type VI secretion system tube protein Hcp [Sedimentisphaerales bacterium]
MKARQIRAKLIVVSLVAAAVVLISLNAGGGLEPPGPPGSPESAMPSLKEIYTTTSGTQPPQTTAYDGFLKIEGIEGECTDEHHKDWIEVLSYSHGVTQPTTVLGGTTGRCDHQDFSVVKTLDKASPKLALYCCNGEHIPEVKLQFCTQASDVPQRQFMEYTLSDVIISETKPKGGTMAGESRPLEDVSFNYAKIEWIYTFYSLDGKGNDVITSWDVAANKTY